MSTWGRGAGIAYDSTRDNIYITGKYWPRVYRIELDPAYEVRVAQVDQARAECIPQ
jgi:Glutamine cyclotransferase